MNDAKLLALKAKVRFLKRQSLTQKNQLLLVSTENEIIARRNHEQFLELEYLRPIFKAAENLLSEAEEYELDDGLGKGASQSYWDALSDAIEPSTDAIGDAIGVKP